MNICFYFPWVNKYLEVDGKCIFNFFVVCQRALQSHPPSLHPLVVSVRVLTAPPPCWHLILPVALLPNNLKIQSCIVLINYGCMIMSIFPILDTMRVILSSIQCLTYSRFLINNNFKKVFIEYRLGEIATPTRLFLDLLMSSQKFLSFYKYVVLYLGLHHLGKPDQLCCPARPSVPEGTTCFTEPLNDYILHCYQGRVVRLSSRTSHKSFLFFF